MEGWEGGGQEPERVGGGKRERNVHEHGKTLTFSTYLCVSPKLSKNCKVC